METNMNTSGQSALIVSFKAGASDAVGSIVLNMGTATSAVLAAPTVATTYNGVTCTTITGASAVLPGVLTSSGNTNPTITVNWTITALTSGTSYCFVVGTFAAQTAVTNNASANSYTVTATIDGTDSSTATIALIASDQVSVTATVPETFTMSIQNTTDPFSGNLSTSSAVGTSGDNVTITTNAAHGWNLWASDSNIGLKSTLAGGATQIPSTTPGSNASLVANTAGYVTGIPAANITQGSGSGGTTAATTAYASSAVGNGSGLNTTPTIIASSAGTANAAIVKPVEYAMASGSTPAATDYADTVTFVGAGSF
jgi:hypothetical protein